MQEHTATVQLSQAIPQFFATFFSSAHSSFGEGVFYGATGIVFLTVMAFPRSKKINGVTIFFLTYSMLLFFLGFVTDGEFAPGSVRLPAKGEGYLWPLLAVWAVAVSQVAVASLWLKEQAGSRRLTVYTVFFCGILTVFFPWAAYFPEISQRLHYGVLFLSLVFTMVLTLAFYTKRSFIGCDYFYSRGILLVWVCAVWLGDAATASVSLCGVDILYKGMLFFELCTRLWLSKKYVRYLQKYALELTVAKEDLKNLSYSDSLTKLYNRRFFDEALLSVLKQRGLKLSESVCLIFIDIDHFKKFNDSYGHQVGDIALVALARTIKECTRVGTDLPCRFGGEEFTIIFKGPLPAALRTAEEIRLRYAAVSLPVANKHDQTCTEGHASVTVSLGVALAQAGETSESLIARADKALYKAKSTGRNRTVCAE